MRHNRTQRPLKGIEQLEDRRVLALGATLVADINQGPAGSNPKSGADLNGTLFFTAIDESAERGLWTLNNATGGAARFHDVPADRNNAFPEELTNVDGTLFFAATTPELDPISRLWKSDGSPAGTELVEEDTRVRPRGLTNFAGKLLYHHPNFSGEVELWVSDGTAETLQIASLAEDPYGYTNVGGTLFFFTQGDLANDEIWKTDGTVAGTVKVRGLETYSVSDDAELNGRFFFTATGDGGNGNRTAALYKSDGTFGGTQPIFSVTAPDVSIHDVVNVNGTLYFNLIEGAGTGAVSSLWKSNGFAAGTVKVTEQGSPRGLADVNNTLWFVGYDAEHGFELWTSDGTEAGTALLKDFNPGPADGFPETANITVVGGTAFLRASDDVHGLELWASDGTAAGTRRITDSPEAAFNVNAPEVLGLAGGTLYLSAVDELHGRELWKITDQTAPTLGGGGTVTYVENAAALTIWPSARVADPDSPNFKFGKLRLTVPEGSDANDRLAIQSQGTGPGQISVSGGQVRYGGVVIGTRSGDRISTLTVTFNGQATPAAAQALVRALTFRTLGDDPSTTPRTLALQISDGDGGFSNVINKTVEVREINDAPRLVLGGQVTYRNNANPIRLAPFAAVSDADSEFIGGLLTVDVTTARGPTNRLLVGGLYSMQDGQLLRDGVVVGTVLEDGVGWNALRIRFNNQMTPARVQELVRSLYFRTVGNDNLDPRTVSFSLTDGEGGVSATQFKRVNLTGMPG